MTRKVPALRVKQNGRVFYLTAVPAAELLAVTAVDVWHIDEEGYQRAPSQQRKNQIANYLSGEDSVLPLGGLLNARPENEAESAYGSVLKFELQDQVSEEIDIGTLALPDADHPLWVVDMQHRLGGLETAIARGDDLRDFPVVVTIADGLSKVEEVEQFELINTTQKKVRTDLARRLLAIRARDSEQRVILEEHGKLWEAKGPVIVDWLNRHCSVWQDRIQEPNSSKKDRPKAIAKEASFVTSLKPVLKTPLLSRVSAEKVGELLGIYWELLGELWPEAFNSPTEHVIQRTPGYFSLHEVAPDIFELARQSSSGLRREGLRDAIKPLSQIDTDFWHKDDGMAAQFGSMKGFAILAGELRAFLPEIDLSFD
jgi:DGQHR domain-containing protein